MRLLAVIALFGGLLRLGAAEPVTWKVWWDDGSGLKIFHSSRGGWDSIPEEPGVQVVLVCEAAEWKLGYPYRVIYRGADWYWFDGQRIQKSYGDGAPNGKWTPRPHAAARPGITIARETFDAYQRQAMEDVRCDP